MQAKINPADFTIREANENDADLIYGFIMEMAAYEKETDEVEASVEKIRNTICSKRFAEGLIGEYQGIAVAYAVFFYSYSTYLGKPGIYLEDLYVKQEYRGAGFGKTILAFLAKTALERGCERFDWSCLDWNEPSIKFYKKMGAEALSNRTIYRLHGDALVKMAHSGDVQKY